MKISQGPRLGTSLLGANNTEGNESNISGNDGDETDASGNGEDETVPLNNDDESVIEPTRARRYEVPVDKGWAWVILAGCVFRVFIFGGLMQSFGVFFLQYQQRFNASASQTATMSVVQNLVISFSALFVMTVGLKKFSSRTIVMTGGVLLTISYLVTAFTTNLYVFYFVQGIFGGLGLSFISGPMFAILSVYFSKHKGFANSLFTAGGSAGGLVFGPIVIKLFEEYGFSGTMMIVSGLMFNILVSGALMRPPEFYTRHAPTNGNLSDSKRTSDHEVVTKCLSTSENDIDHSGDIRNGIHDENKTSHIFVERKSKFEMQRMLSYDPELLKTVGSHSPVLQRVRANSLEPRRRTVSQNTTCSTQHKESLSRFGDIMTAISRSQAGLSISEATMCGSFVDINNIAPPSPVKETEDTASPEEETFCRNICDSITWVLRTVFDVHLLRDVKFLYFLFMAFCGVSSVGLIPVYTPAYAHEIGISNERIGMVVSIYAAIDFFAKIGMGVVTDRNWIRRNHSVGLSFFIIGTACHFMRYFKTFESLLIFVVISGLCCGQYISTFAVLLSDLIGQDKFKQSFGFSTLTHGISIAIVFPLAGLIKDNTQSYVNAFHLTGGLAFVAGFCCLTLPIVQKWTSSKQKQADEKKT